mmetsp:Transcript_6262/g.20739  ORF Transcript_6262/g.20739 Transcript_6262/m.20739 type:complete len:178 (-) Transcript_6262:282-815(-)
MAILTITAASDDSERVVVHIDYAAADRAARAHSKEPPADGGEKNLEELARRVAWCEEEIWSEAGTGESLERRVEQLEASLGEASEGSLEERVCVETGLPTDEEMDLTHFINDWGPYPAGSGRAEKALSRRKERKALLALKPGETVYYTDRTKPFRRHGAHDCDEVEYGELCHVVGPA